MKLKNKKFKITNELVFYCTMLAIPIFMFVVLNIVINIEYLLLSFREYNPLNNTYSWVGFDNFTRVIRQFSLEESTLRTAFYNSLELFAWKTFLGTPLAILFAYYIARKRTFSGFFQILLFLPTIISSMVMVFLYSYFMDTVIPQIMLKMFGKEMFPPVGDIKTQWSMIILYNIVFSFGGNMLIFIGSITSISDEIIESAQLDGASPIKELIFIVCPLIFPTITTFVVVRIASMFADNASLYSFFGSGATHQTIGYNIYKNIMDGTASLADYPNLSSIGILFSVIIIPITLVIRKLLEKVGTVE